MPVKRKPILPVPTIAERSTPTIDGSSESAPAEEASTNSSCSSNDATVKHPKGGKLVQSRYMQQYEKKKIATANLQNTTIYSGGKAPERTGSGTPTRRSTAPPRFKAPTGPGVLDGTILGKGDLQSTLLEGHKIALPDLDLSVINDSYVHQAF